MSVRLTTAVLLAGLVFAAQARAEDDPLNPEHFLDGREAETVALIAADLAAESHLNAEVDLLNPDLLNPERFLHTYGTETDVLIAVSLATAAPARPEVDLLHPARFLDPRDTEETVSLIAFDLAVQRGLALSQPSLDQSPPVAKIPESELVDLRPLPEAPVEWVDLAPSDQPVEFVSLAPALFLDRQADETLAWIAADLASAGDITTGSIMGENAGPAAHPMEESAGRALTDDALSFEQYLFP